MNQKIKEYLWSSLVTFAAAFLMAIVPMLTTDLQMSQAALFALLMTGLRAGVRAILNLSTTRGQSV